MPKAEKSFRHGHFPTQYGHCVRWAGFARKINGLLATSPEIGGYPYRKTVAEQAHASIALYCIVVFHQ
jgi:hypothetical protein